MGGAMQRQREFSLHARFNKTEVSIKKMRHQMGFSF